MGVSTVRIICVGIALLPARMSFAASPACRELEQSTAAQLVDYLKGDRAGLKTECIQFAISSLGAPVYVPATGVLVSYLDFRVPQPKRFPYHLDHLVWMEEYPAANILFEIGMPAVGNLIRAIGDIDSSDLLQTNSEEVLRAIYRDDPPGAIAALRASSRSAPDAVTAARLFESAIRLTRMCGLDEIRGACEAALN